MRTTWAFSSLLLLVACGNVEVKSAVGRACQIPTGSKSVSVSWTANHEKAVNSVGGGYRVYYCDYSGFPVSAGSYVDVPFSSGSAAPTTGKITGLGSGVLYVTVVGYSALKPPGSTSGAQSAASSEVSVTVP